MLKPAPARGDFYPRNSTTNTIFSRTIPWTHLPAPLFGGETKTSFNTGHNLQLPPQHPWSSTGPHSCCTPVCHPKEHLGMRRTCLHTWSPHQEPTTPGAVPSHARTVPRWDPVTARLTDSLGEQGAPMGQTLCPLTEVTPAPTNHWWRRAKRRHVPILRCPGSSCAGACSGIRSSRWQCCPPAATSPG